MSPGFRQFNAKFFEATGLKWFTDFTRRTAYTVGKGAVYDYAKLSMSDDPTVAAQAKAMASVVNLDIGEALKLSREDWIKTDNARQAVSTWIEEATLRPNASTRPARMSDARMGLVWFLHDFQWAMHAKTLTYVAQQSKLQPTVLAKMLPWMAAAIPMMIAGALGLSLIHI